MQKKDKLYYARILPSTGTYEVCELTVRTVEEDYFVGVDKRDKHAYLLPYFEIDKTAFVDRQVALDLVLRKEKEYAG